MPHLSFRPFSPDSHLASNGARNVGPRVVVTGVGMVTPLGCVSDEIWSRMLERFSAVQRSNTGDVRGHAKPFRCAPVENFRATDVIADKRALRSMDRATTLGVAAAVAAAIDSGLELGRVSPGRLGVFVGSAARSYDPADFLPAVTTSCDDNRLNMDRFGATGIELVDPTWLLKTLGHSVLFHLTVMYRAVGVNANFPSGGDAGAVAVGEGYRAIKRGEIDVALVGGYDSLLHPERVALYERAELLSHSNGASRPFDRARDGFAAGEGAGFLVLEDEAHARRRMARPYAALAGYGSAFFAESPHRIGATRRGFASALGRALDDAGWTSVDAVFAHGLGTPAMDVEEAAGISECFENGSVPEPLVTATTPLVGYTCAAAAAIDIGAACHSLRRGHLLPILLDTPEPACRLRFVTPKTSAPISRVAVNAANLAGAHTAVMLERAE